MTLISWLFTHGIDIVHVSLVIPILLIHIIYVFREKSLEKLYVELFHVTWPFSSFSKKNTPTRRGKSFYLSDKSEQTSTTTTTTNSNNNQPNEENGIENGSKSITTDDQIDQSITANPTNDVDNNECDSGESNSGSFVVDDEQPSSSSNSITHNNHERSDTNLNGSHIIYDMVELAIGDDWYLYCDSNCSNIDYIEEKIYEDLCYVPINRGLPEVQLPTYTHAILHVTYSVLFICLDSVVPFALDML